VSRDRTEVSEAVGSALGRIARETALNISGEPDRPPSHKRRNAALAGIGGVAAAAGLAAAAPSAAKRAGKVLTGAVLGRVTSPVRGAKGLVDKSGWPPDALARLKDAAGERIEHVRGADGGAAGATKQAGKRTGGRAAARGRSAAPSRKRAASSSSSRRSTSSRRSSSSQRSTQRGRSGSSRKTTAGGRRSKGGRASR
jgi:hypothetical protein